MLFCMLYQVVGHQSDIFLQPNLVPTKVNGYFNQLLEIYIPQVLNQSTIEIIPSLKSKYRMFRVYPYKTSLANGKYIPELKSYVFNKVNSGMNVFNLITDWDQEDKIEVAVLNNLNTIFEVKKSSELLFSIHQYLIVVYASITAISTLFLVKFFWDISQILPFLFAIAALTLPKYQTILDLRLKYTDLSYKNYPMTDYSSDWITYDTKAVEKALKDKVTYTECRLCNFKPNLIYNNRSTERDIILISIVGASSGFESAISARTAGFKGKILIFTDSEVPDRIKKCGAYVIHTSTTIYAGLYLKQYIRFPLIASFIDKFGSYFDRLIYIDTSDVMFHSDPFNWNDDVVQLSDENSPYYNNFFVKRWGPQFVGLDHEWFKDKGNIICSGVCGGTGKALGPLVKLVSGYWRPGEDVIPDQGVLDFILASNIPKNAGIKFVSNNDLATVGIRLCDNELIKQFEIDGPPNFKDNLFNIYPAIVHQINRNSQIQNKFNELCK